MHFDLSREEKAVGDNALEIGRRLGINQAKRISPYFSKEDWELCAETGLASLLIPKAMGGSGFNALETGLTLEGLTRGECDGGFAFSIGAHLLAGLLPLVKHANPEMQQRIFPKIISGEILLCNAMTESASGSNAFAMRTKTYKTENGYLLQGNKVFVTNAPIADAVLVYALTDEDKGFFGGISCFLLEKKFFPYEVLPTDFSSAYRNALAGQIYFNELAVPETALVGKKGSGAMIFHESMCWERACMALMHCGTMESLINSTADYVKGRRTPKGSLSDLQAVQFHLADMATQAEAARMLAYKALKEIDSGKDATVSAARAKIACSEALEFVASKAVKLWGANSMVRLLDTAVQALQAAQAACIYSGPNDVLREMIAGRS